MTDTLTPEKRSWNMSRIHAKDTAIEVAVRKFLFSKGFRFRKNDKRLPGTPDIVLPKYNTVIFIHGCFWHHHQGCKMATTPKTNTEYWDSKFSHNIANDKSKQEQLKMLGWKVVVLWQCDIKARFDQTMSALTIEIQNNINFKGTIQ